MTLTNEQLQSLRNQGNECEDAADEITELRGRIAELQNACSEMNSALSRCAYLSGPPNEQEASWYDVEPNPQSAVDAVRTMRNSFTVRIADLETRLKESQELSDVSVPLCHEHEAKIAELERRLTDAEAMVEQVWIDKGIAALQDKLQVAWDKTAELETRLACARAEAIEQCAAECDGSTKAGMYIASDIRALAAAPQGYVCVKAEADTITLQNMIGQWYLDDMSPPLARMRGVYKVLAAARK